MADQSGRQPFRFRIPWVMYTTPTAPRPPTQPQPQPQPHPQPTQPTTSVRPPFRPAGVASPRLPSPPQVPSRTDSQPPSPARTAASTPPSPDKTALPIRSAPRLSSWPPSPSKTASSQIQAPSKTESQPVSPTRTAPKSQASSQPSSPSIHSLSPPTTPPTTDSKPSIPSPTTPKSQAPSQLQSPSPTSKMQSTTRTSSKPSSPSLIRTQPQQVYQPPSPSPTDSQIATQTSSQPPSSHMVSQVGAATRIASQPQSPPSLQAFQLQQTTKKPSPPPSPPKSSAFQTDLLPTKSQPELSELPSKYPSKAEGSSRQIYQPDQIRQPPQGSPAVLVDPRQHQAPEGKAELKKEGNSTVPVDEERKQRTTPEFTQMASVSNTQPKGQLDSSEEEKQQRRKHAGTHEKDMMAKVATEKERNPVVPNTQKARHATTDYHPLAPQGESSNLHKEIRDDISRFTHKMSLDHPEKTIDENPVSVITLTGENKGASMQLGSEAAKKDSSVRIHRGYKLNHGDISEATTDGESSAKPRYKDPKTREDTAQTIYINSNTQSVNNSLVQNSSINERNPGVHVVFTNNTTNAMKSNKITESVETKKADFNITQPQKLTYEPIVKRRCLRGLLLESSDSDPDNPDKPRRHGCRYDCREKQSGNDQ